MENNEYSEKEVFYSSTTLKQIFDVSESTIRRWKKEGKLPPPTLINGFERYSSEDLKTLVDRQNPHRSISEVFPIDLRKALEGK